MEQNVKFRLLENIGKVYEQSIYSKLDAALFKDVDAELKQLSDYFKVTPTQSPFIAMVLSLNMKGEIVDMKELIGYFDCNPMKLLEFNDDFEELYSKGIFRKRRSSSHRRNLALASEQFTINEKILKAILQNKSMPAIERDVIKNVFELLENFNNLCDQRVREELSTFNLFEETRELISS